MKYTARDNLLEELKLLPFFDKERIFQLGTDEKKYNLKKSTIDTYISRYLKCREIIPIKKGLYIHTNFYNTHKDNTSYLFYLANILRKPSYVSSWAALQHYSLTTEIIHIVTCITPKKTQNYNTKIGTFSYQSIQDDLFSDFILIKHANQTNIHDFEFFIATPAKALFDLLYFKTKQFKGITLKDISVLVDELRIDIAEMDDMERNRFYLLLKKYIK